MRADVEAVLPSVRADLEALVRIPSVSSDASLLPDVQRCCSAVADLLRAEGLAVTVLSVAGGLPAVVGRRAAPPGAPTVLLYAHYDVQPVGSGWSSPPFDPVERDGRLYGRGAADDKAGIAVHLAALRALVPDLPVGVVVLVEGEEEIGSPSLPGLLAAHRDLLAADVLVLADAMNWRVGVPALTTTLRGGVSAVVEVRTLERPVHNGVFGGPVPDALTCLSRLLATLHDTAGDVAVPGLVRGKADPLDLTEADLRADAGVLDGVHLIGTGSLTSRLWAAPALSVVGIDAPPVEGSSMVLVPRARARIALRLAPGQDPSRALDALSAHLTAAAPWGAQVTVTPGGTVAPFTAATSGWAYDAAHRALSEAWGVPAVDVGVGGSIGFIASFAEAFPDAQILVTGVEDPDTSAHGPDESLHLADFARACLAETLLLELLAAPTTPP
ncbi:MAG TPA: dipeptidase [Mycobacteriales bacterium]|jgi:acetylornithine deacetylase/succinyl-diaminopimelate desuccinylase-like protein|nr:dipeptidase [Mycobacteriales bacterium]